MYHEIISLLNTISKLYSEFARNSSTTREFLAYQELFARTEDYITQLNSVVEYTGTVPTADEAKETIAQIMYDFVKSFTNNDEISKVVEDYEEGQLLAIEASLS